MLDHARVERILKNCDTAALDQLNTHRPLHDIQTKIHTPEPRVHQSINHCRKVASDRFRTGNAHVQAQFTHRTQCHLI